MGEKRCEGERVRRRDGEIERWRWRDGGMER